MNILFDRELHYSCIQLHCTGLLICNILLGYMNCRFTQFKDTSGVKATINKGLFHVQVYKGLIPIENKKIDIVSTLTLMQVDRAQSHFPGCATTTRINFMYSV